MELLLSIKNSLGFNESLFVHLACFAVSYISLYLLVYKPYSQALLVRRARTVGQEEAADKMNEEAVQLQTRFEAKAKSLNVEINKFYEESRASASREYDRIVDAAQTKTGEILKSARAQLGKETAAARDVLQRDIPSVGSAIATKLSGKEIAP
jgi:F0F1-type ATP synthase membrane subunit b/b'